MTRVRLVDYDPAWPAAYEAIAERILQACAPHVVEIHHIGSTSVPGLPAKPVIDVMPGLATYEDGLAIVPAMEALGYQYRGDFGIPRRHYFKGLPEHVGREQNIHCYAVGEGQWHWHLAFRDHLRANPADRDRYFALKSELAAQYPDDVESYAMAKHDFVMSILRQHLEIDPAYLAR